MARSTLPVPKPGKSVRVAGLNAGEDGVMLARLARAQREPMVVFTASPFDAQRLLDEIAWFDPGLTLALLPDWETLPYDHFSPHPDLVSERLATLYQLTQRACDIVIIAAGTALVRLPPPAFLAARSFMLERGQRLNLEALRAQCAQAGYHFVDQVMAPGEFSVRGGLVDLFPMGSVLPFRLDLFDDEIESIRTFDVDTQRSLYPVNTIHLLPAREFPLDADGIACFRKKFRETFEGDPSRCRIYKDISHGIAPGGVEWYLPLFFGSSATLFDYLPQDTLLVLHGALEQALSAYWQETGTRHRLLDHDREHPILPPAELLMPVDAFFSAMHTFARMHFAPPDAPAGRALPDLAVDRRADNPLHRLCDFAAGFRGRILIAAESPGRRETLAQLMARHGMTAAPCESWEEFTSGQARLMLGIAPLHHGLVTGNMALITETELYPGQVRQERRRDRGRAPRAEGVLRDLSELHENDPVVHEQHGVGRYRGLVTMNFGEENSEFLLLEYADADKLYVPVAQLHLVSRYAGAPPESAPLHKLGSGQWDKAKKKALGQIRDTAAELLQLYALRAVRQGHAFKLALNDYEAFAEKFPFEETPDQAAAIEAVIADMQSGRPMDRLVCGDVGFGKTEVALRAAFVAVMGGRQVALLVPTTLLAEQHYNTFCDRFAEWPVKIAEISRFRTAGEQKQALDDLHAGRLDIIIGTHRLLQKDVRFSNLGLVILDEEHRFGVQQKEKLKALRAEVDVLTLTATPIPRTLSMAMEGLREFSVIATPPRRRLSIKTFVTPWSEGILREAVTREFKRGGQVYFLYNEVDSIYAMRDRLEKILPEARIGIAHGQLRERELEQVMKDFYQQRFNLLLCSTIIETGIDVPSANTILIHRADRFGLAQLHQLRGRVGRSHHQAYAYLLIERDIKVTSQAQKRLDAIQMLEDLGAGFHLAMHDLEIRGAGELLGENQSGEMQEIGFNLYADLLTRTVKQMQAGKTPDPGAPLNVSTEINLHAPALLPGDYCPDVRERLSLYKRLADCPTEDTLGALQEELTDRFGPLPPQAQVLLACHRLRALSVPLGVVRMDASDTTLQIQFDPHADVDPLKLVTLLQNHRNARMHGPEKLRVSQNTHSADERASALRELLAQLA